MCPARRPFWSIALLVVAVLLTVLLGAAASAQVATLGSPTPETSAEPASPTLGDQDALLAWAACMRENGVEMDDPRFGLEGELIGGLGKDGAGKKGDTNGEAYQAAREACAGYVTAFKAPADAEQRSERAGQLLAWAGCMRDQGVDLPDPNADGTFPDYDWKLDLKGDDYTAAVEICRETAGGLMGK